MTPVDVTPPDGVLAELLERLGDAVEAAVAAWNSPAAPEGPPGVRCPRCGGHVRTGTGVLLCAGCGSYAERFDLRPFDATVKDRVAYALRPRSAEAGSLGLPSAARTSAGSRAAAEKLGAALAKGRKA